MVSILCKYFYVNMSRKITTFPSGLRTKISIIKSKVDNIFGEVIYFFQ